MKHVIRQIEQQVKRNEQLLKTIEQSLKNAPLAGYLRACCHQGHFEYYVARTKKDRSPQYLPKNEYHIARKLAQRDYDLKMMTVIRKEQIELHAALIALKKYWSPPSTGLQPISKNLAVPPYTSSARRALINPYLISDEEFCRQWETVDFISNPYHPENKNIVTDKGDLVRSKSEKIIADKLYSLKIPYRYEAPLNLKTQDHGQCTLYPDFTLLRTTDRAIIYLEHFGRMGDQTYRTGALQKMLTYGVNGIQPGINAIFTFEDDSNSLDSRYLLLCLKSLGLC